MLRLGAPSLTPACLQCGTEARPGSTFCRRCGLPVGTAPPEHADLPSCPVCYREAQPDGRLPSPERPGLRLSMPDHVAEHERRPVGDDELLESLRVGDRIRVGRWLAPYDVVRRYLVTGALDGGRRRRLEHDAIVTAMTQIARWGVDAELFGDQPEWQAARAAVAELMERYHRR
jgi:hypothetical protein